MLNKAEHLVRFVNPKRVGDLQAEANISVPGASPGFKSKLQRMEEKY
jgi:hypothetical protein